FGVMILAIVISFVTTLLLGFEDIPVEDSADSRADSPASTVSHSAVKIN
ncbi:TPA: hypothetical protein R3O59_004255, partial [Yersinia enterocolitica]|nr:hypothetical protein [Yersinia enterocolitica]